MTGRRLGTLGTLGAVGVVTVLGCVLAGYLTYRVNRDDTVAAATPPADRAQIGRTYSTGIATDTTPVVTAVRLPLGGLVVTAGVGARSVSDPDGTDLQAPAHGTFVALDTAVDDAQRVVPRAVTPSEQYLVDVSLALVANGTRYHLPAERGDRLSVVVGVPAPIRSLVLEVTSNGVTQRADLVTGRVSAGAAALLYAAAASGAKDCGAVAITAPFVTSGVGEPLSCRVAWRRLPWLPSLGWAPAGSAWLLAAITTRGPAVLDRVADGRREQYVDDDSAGRLTVRCGADAPRAAVPDSLPRALRPDYHLVAGTSYVACRVPASGAVSVPLSVDEQPGVFLGPGPDATVHIGWRPVLGG